MQNDLATAHPAFDCFVVPESQAHCRLARAESDLEGPDAGRRIAAFVLARAARQSGPGSNAALGWARWWRCRRTNALKRDPCLAPSGHIDLKLTVPVVPMDLALDPAAIHHYLDPVVKIVLPVGVIFHGELPDPPQFGRI